MNFLLHLRQQVKQTQPTQRRTLCLLVVYNAPLIPAWLKSLNNLNIIKLQRACQKKKDSHLDETSVERLQGVLEEEKCWAGPDNGLTVWNAHAHGPPPLTKDGTFGYDVVLITASTLTRAAGNWVLNSKYSTIIADEAHDFLRGQQNSVSNTLKMWFQLLNRTISTFLLTGSPFMTNICHDFVAMTKAIAANDKRTNWSPDCSDEGLDHLVSGYIGVNEKRYDKALEQQKEIRKKMTGTLAIYTLRRDEKSRIRGKEVMKDYFAECLNLEDPLVPEDGGQEAMKRDVLYQEFRGIGAKRLTQQRNDDMRCLCFSHRFIQWERCKSPAQRAAVWDSYTLEEASGHIRTAALIDYLREKKAKQDGVIIYVQRRFQAELCVKAESFKKTSTNGQICQLLGLSFGFIGAQDTRMLRLKFSDASQKATIDKCRAGTLDVAVCSVQSAKNGCNLQGMSAMVSLGWIGRYMEEIQAKGMRTEL